MDTLKDKNNIARQQILQINKYTQEYEVAPFEPVNNSSSFKLRDYPDAQHIKKADFKVSMHIHPGRPQFDVISDKPKYIDEKERRIREQQSLESFKSLNDSWVSHHKLPPLNEPMSSKLPISKQFQRRQGGK